jgi:hypothetical protein
MINFEERRRRMDAFEEILIPHPRMDEVKRRIRALIDDTRARIARNDERVKRMGGRSEVLDHLWVLPIIGPSGATKSKTIGSVIEHILTDKTIGDSDIPIQLATLRTSTKSPRYLQGQILEAYGDASAEQLLKGRDYSEARVNADIRAIARDRKTMVVVFDEAHNMIIDEATKRNVAMAKAMKSLVNDGIFSIVCVGTDQMKQLFAADKELAGRLKTPIDFGAFSINHKRDREYFFNFVGLLESAMFEKGVIDKEIGLLDTAKKRACVYDFAGGVIGSVSRIIGTALDDALDDGRGSISWDDIAHAIHARNLVAESTGQPTYYDPFKKGPHRNTLSILEQEEDEG